MSRTTLDWLLHWAEHRPERIFLRQPIGDQVNTWSWAESRDEVLRMAAALARYPRGSRIGITGRNTAHWVLADLAIAAAGHISIGFYAKQTTDLVRYIAGHAGLAAVFVGPMLEQRCVLDGFRPHIDRIRLPYPEVSAEREDWHSLLASHPPLKLRSPDPDEVWTLVYTSGTTGDPKGVMLSFGAATRITTLVQTVLPYRSDERFFSYLPLAHIFERGSVAGAALASGGCIDFMDSLDRFAEQLRAARPTRFCAVPLIWQRMQIEVQKQLPAGTGIEQLPEASQQALLKGLGLDRCYFAVSGAAPCPTSVLAFFEALGLPIHQGYGMTENFAYVSCNLPGANRLGTVGRAFPGVEIRIGEAGEILTRHSGQMLGYFREPEKSAQVLDAEGWLHTGDLGSLDAEGYLSITGRIKDQFKTAKGLFVMPIPIENALLAHPAIASACVIGSGLKAPVALVNLPPAPVALEVKALRALLLPLLQQVNAALGAAEQLARLIVIHEAWSIDNQLLTPTLKIRRNEMEARYGALAAAALAQPEPIVLHGVPP
ncbi:MAG: AMP-binding protein [Pseudomonadota bacterium]